MTAYILDWSILRCIFLPIIITRCIDCNHRFAPFGCHSCRRYARYRPVVCQQILDFDVENVESNYFDILFKNRVSHISLCRFCFFLTRNKCLFQLSLKTQKQKKKQPKPVLQIEVYLIYII